jgi:hypothetical protein
MADSAEGAEVTTEVTTDDVETDGEITPPETENWWQFASKDQAEAWANNLVSKRITRHKKTHVDPIAAERDTLKAEVDRLKPFEAATQTETERLQAERKSEATELAALREFKAQTEHANLVRSIALEIGLPEAFIPRVTGSTEDEIREDATDLLNALSEGGSNTKKVPPSKAPKDADKTENKNLSNGGGGDGESDDDLIKDILGQVAQDRKNGGLMVARR